MNLPCSSPLSNLCFLLFLPHIGANWPSLMALSGTLWRTHGSLKQKKLQKHKVIILLSDTGYWYWTKMTDWHVFVYAMNVILKETGHKQAPNPRPRKPPTLYSIFTLPSWLTALLVLKRVQGKQVSGSPAPGNTWEPVAWCRTSIIVKTSGLFHPLSMQR